MQRTTLGDTAVEISLMGFGGGPLGNLFAEVDDASATRALERAWERGISYFDTAPHYGIGLSERRFGSFLASRPRESYTLSTKVGRLLVPQDDEGRRDEAFEVPASYRRVWDFSRDGIRRSLEESLTRMGLDRADIVYLHDVESQFEPAVTSGHAALAELRDEGVVGAIGAGMGDATKLATLVERTDVDVVMLAGRYTLLDQSGLDRALPACQERGVAVIVAAVFNSGVLARPEVGSTYEYAAAPPEVVQRAQRIAQVCRDHGVGLPSAALAFPATHPAVSGIMVGMRSPEEVEANVADFSAGVPAGLWADLRDQGLIDARVPVASGSIPEEETR